MVPCVTSEQIAHRFYMFTDELAILGVVVLAIEHELNSSDVRLSCVYFIIGRCIHARYPVELEQPAGLGGISPCDALVVGGTGERHAPNDATQSNVSRLILETRSPTACLGTSARHVGRRLTRTASPDRRRWRRCCDVWHGRRHSRRTGARRRHRSALVTPPTARDDEQPDHVLTLPTPHTAEPRHRAAQSQQVIGQRRGPLHQAVAALRPTFEHVERAATGKAQLLVALHAPERRLFNLIEKTLPFGRQESPPDRFRSATRAKLPIAKDPCGRNGSSIGLDFNVHHVDGRRSEWP